MLRYAIFALGVLGALYLSYGVSSLVLLLNNSQMALPDYDTVSMTEAPDDEYGYLDLGGAASAEDLLADPRTERTCPGWCLPCWWPRCPSPWAPSLPWAPSSTT